jgi:hypothetical protein
MESKADSFDIEALKAILRLKAGLSPLNHLEDITVNFEKCIEYLDGLRGLCLKTGNALGVVTGRYGNGKTHFLLVSKQYAISEGYGVAHFSQDTGLCSLGHPQRHAMPLLASLRIPPHNELLLEHLRYCLDDTDRFRIFCEHLCEIAADNSPVSPIARKALEYCRLHNGLRQSSLYWYLSGARLGSMAPNPTSRLHAYNLMRFWVRYSTSFLGCKGIMILVDEVEKLFDLLPVSRRAAYRTISFYVRSLRPCILLCAITPRAWELLLSEIRDELEILLGYATLLPEEEIKHLRSALQMTTPHEVSKLNRNGYVQLMERLRTLHAKARGYVQGNNAPELHCPPISPEMTPRIFARSIISSLEASWANIV